MERKKEFNVFEDFAKRKKSFERKIRKSANLKKSHFLYGLLLDTWFEKFFPKNLLIELEPKDVHLYPILVRVANKVAFGNEEGEDVIGIINHEMDHAMQTMSEDLKINSYGVFLAKDTYVSYIKHNKGNPMQETRVASAPRENDLSEYDKIDLALNKIAAIPISIFK